MNGKQIGTIITLIFLVPTLIGIVIWTHKIAKDPTNPDNINEGIKIVANDAIPWWLGLLKWLAGLPGIIGVVLVMALIWFLKSIEEIK